MNIMRHLIIVLIALSAISSFSQTKDYNVKKGAVANGYDVVAYFSNKAIKGNKKFATKYDNVSFYFSSKENLNIFKENPEKYIPQYGGYCAYAIAKKKTKMYVDPEVYEIRDGKLYLFYSSWLSSKLSDWQEGDTKKLQKQGDKNWEDLKYIKK